MIEDVKLNKDGSKLALALIKQVHVNDLEKSNPNHDAKGLFASASDAIVKEAKSLHDTVNEEAKKAIDGLKDDAKKAFLSLSPDVVGLGVGESVAGGLTKAGIPWQAAQGIGLGVGHVVYKHVEKRQKEMRE